MGTQRTSFPTRTAVSMTRIGHTGRTVRRSAVRSSRARLDSRTSVAPFDRAHNLLCVRISSSLFGLKRRFFRIVGPFNRYLEKAGGLGDSSARLDPSASASISARLTPALGSKRQSSTRSACSENSAKFTPLRPRCPQWCGYRARPLFSSRHENTRGMNPSERGGYRRFTEEDGSGR